MTCSEKEDSLPVEMAYDPSMEPVVEKAQHEPHCAWFLTGVTAPLATCTVEGAEVRGVRGERECGRRGNHSRG